jgi:uncharacterized protein YhfF
LLKLAMTKSLISYKRSATTMSHDTTISFTDPAFADELTDLVRAGAQRIIKQAVQAELDAFLAEHGDTDTAGRRQVVRNGYQPERCVLTGIGPVSLPMV